MSDLDFYAHVATRGDVLGTGIGSGPDTWDAALGRDRIDDWGRGRLRLDYGLVELSFSRVEGSVTCFGIGVQVHRLTHGLAVPDSLTSVYGEFAPRVPFEELRTAISSLGFAVEPEDLSGDVHRHRVAGSRVRIHVVADPCAYQRAGDVWSLHVSAAG
ncbi:hypothetical protein OHT52_02260 [Streptomyces sp. NBC_00247]|uniref:hypothetical protein n=1 Tax=Streptomyces sp. NBC_00247 TaxID=2975689 RepID=UPI002E2BF6FC|nr:hypothetical protein [Streptomyces sp. NBC_00247]